MGFFLICQKHNGMDTSLVIISLLFIYFFTIFIISLFYICVPYDIQCAPVASVSLQRLKIFHSPILTCLSFKSDIVCPGAISVSSDLAY